MDNHRPLNRMRIFTYQFHEDEKRMYSADKSSFPTLHVDTMLPWLSQNYPCSVKLVSFLISRYKSIELVFICLMGLRATDCPKLEGRNISLEEDTSLMLANEA